MYTPVALFVYNRPLHTKLTIDSILKNEYSKDTILYIFSDHEKINTTTAEKKNVNAVKNYIRSIQGFKEIHIIERDSNYGLSKNIITGVTQIIDKYQSVIVLEDDMVCSKGFLKYMNDALNFYHNENKVGCIHAWNYNLDYSTINDETFFLLGADCWGWATWSRAWKLFENNGTLLLDKITQSNLEYIFNRRGTSNFVKMLEDQIRKKNDSWAIRWHASLLINGMFCLHPVKTLVNNIGFDGTGEHCGNETLIQYPVEIVNVKKIEIVESEWFYDSIVLLEKTNKLNLYTRIWLNLKIILKTYYHRLYSK
jgi:hypothetical protein